MFALMLIHMPIYPAMREHAAPSRNERVIQNASPIEEFTGSNAWCCLKKP
ncbi:Uncharacterised protein [uncultured archaeon]|nr:Uncharacterised protein [uncultured archaeon]